MSGRGSVVPSFPRRFKCVRIFSGPVTVCCCVRVRFRLTRLLRLCVPIGVLHRTMDHPRVLPSSRVVLSPASLALRPDLPVSLPRPDFAFAYTVRPAVCGRSRRGTRPSQLCVVRLATVPLPIRRRGPQVLLPVSSLRIPAFALRYRARPPEIPAPTSAGVR